MLPELSKDLQQIIDADPDVPPRLVDPRTSRTYILVSSEQYERIKALLEQDTSLSDIYEAQIESAMRAGWGQPMMDEYDHYDQHRR